MATGELLWIEGVGITTALTTELNTLTDGSACAPSSELDNDAGLDRWMAVELVTGTLSGTPDAGGYLEGYTLYKLDGTNYEDGSSSVVPARSPDFIIKVRSDGSGAQRIVERDIPLIGKDFKIMLVNKTGVSLTATGNTLKYLTYNEQTQP